MKRSTVLVLLTPLILQNCAKGLQSDAVGRQPGGASTSGGASAGNAAGTIGDAGTGAAPSLGGASGSATGGLPAAGGEVTTGGAGSDGAAGAVDDGGAGGMREAGGAGGEAGDSNHPGSDTLLAYYRFDSGAGQLAIDSSGHDHNGALEGNPNQGAPTWTGGRLGSALAFAGQAFVRLPYSADWNRINTQGAYTIAVWSKRSSHKASWSVLVSRQYKTSGAEHFALSWRDGRAAALALQYFCESGSTGALNVWVHTAATYDGTILRVFEGGSEVCSVDAPGPMYQDDATAGIIIGGNSNTSDPTVQETFVGEMDELAIYSRAMTAAEISALASGSLPPEQ